MQIQRLRSEEMTSSQVSILIVDTNRVFAKSVKEVLERNVTNAKAHIATNLWEVKRRLDENIYDLILADLSVTMDSDEILEEFKKKDVTVVQWSALQVSRDSKLLRKPLTSTQLKDLVHSLPLPV
jgi:DNA-binding response OmpR family regulator